MHILGRIFEQRSASRRSGHARHLAIQNEPFGFFELDDRPAQAFHTSILKQVLVRPPSLTLRRGSPRVESAREPSGWSGRMIRDSTIG
jgi:hypothetical protein